MPHRLSRHVRVAWAGLLVAVLLLQATLGRGLHELQHLNGWRLGAWNTGSQDSPPDQPDDAPGKHAVCAWCLSQAHAAPGGETPQPIAPLARPSRALKPRPAAPLPDATRWPFAARDPPHYLG